MSKEDKLSYAQDFIEKKRVLEQYYSDREWEIIQDLLADGCSFSDIGALYGFSREAAFQKFGRPRKRTTHLPRIP